MNKKGNPAALNPWKKGQSGNPGGRPKLPAHLKEIDTYSGDELKKTISMFFRMPWKEIQAIIQDPSMPAVDVALASAINAAIIHGDFYKIVPLLERLIGKVKEAPQDVNINLQQVPTSELIALGKQAIEVLEGEITH